jgi:hypothetical protein
MTRSDASAPTHPRAASAQVRRPGTGATRRHGARALSVEIVECFDREGPFARREKTPMGRPAQGKRGQPINRAGAQLMPTCLVTG